MGGGGWGKEGKGTLDSSGWSSTSPPARPLRTLLTPNSTTPSQSLKNPLRDNMPKAATKRGAAGKVEKKRGKKDPNAPKRGLSAYMFFANEQRENVREENPGISFGQVGKILGERWKALNDKQRAPYEAKAAADKKRYEDEKQAYNSY
ncbi:hypothetical protein CGMCC3_g8767 [Colletotrichum fructicola]|uniref:Non-histone chromosomal protein 6 n=2 Tax=Colletotrichum gloeosporioides species complex TaxID=2707338 RepID=A0A7J6INT3_COLFN|nr:uncharacterized protein CGMCC3_g8767 [Colletotrichum fructicola]KAE9575445.1 hypothetical protein CGMCC3_g8767 [Colletotrichum fructicola]KAF4477945.1 Non-histone chromosomal protein 6 [Colletotrichum fructicola Nara gc5]